MFRSWPEGGLAERGCPGVQSGERGLTRREDRPKVDA